MHGRTRGAKCNWTPQRPHLVNSRRSHAPPACRISPDDEDFSQLGSGPLQPPAPPLPPRKPQPTHFLLPEPTRADAKCPADALKRAVFTASANASFDLPRIGPRNGKPTRRRPLPRDCTSCASEARRVLTAGARASTPWAQAAANNSVVCVLILILRARIACRVRIFRSFV